MKDRVISAVLMLLIFIPVFILGGTLFQMTVYLISLLGLKEFLDVKETKKAIPPVMKFLSYVIYTFLVLTNLGVKDFVFTVDFRVIAALSISFLLPVTLFHNKNEYNVNDAFYLIGGIFFLGTSFHLLIILRNIEANYLIYLFIVTIMTDTYAYLGGMLVGRRKLIESVSPKKTIEGLVIGTLAGTFLAAVFYNVVIDPNLSLITLFFMTLFLSILGQFGDLVFSSIKRYFGKKDFSNLIKGHGGILDRLDSIIFVILGFLFFIAMI